MDVENLIKKYNEKYFEFAQINDINLEERAKKIPYEKHFWVSRLIDEKMKYEKLKRKKKKMFREIAKELHEESPVALTRNTLKDKVENTKEIEKINETLADLEMLISFLEQVVKNISFIGQDIKNIIAILELNEL